MELVISKKEYDFECYYGHRLFEGLATQKSMVEYLLSIDPKFRLESELINDKKIISSLLISHYLKRFTLDASIHRLEACKNGFYDTLSLSGSH